MWLITKKYATDNKKYVTDNKLQNMQKCIFKKTCTKGENKYAET